jgi:hypothetical protein
MSATATFSIFDWVNVLTQLGPGLPVVIADVQAIYADTEKLITDVTKLLPTPPAPVHTPVAAAMVSLTDHAACEKLAAVYHVHAPVGFPKFDGHRIANLMKFMQDNPQLAGFIMQIIQGLLTKAA